LPPDDVEAWAHAMYFYAHCAPARARQETLIRENYAIPRWRNVALNMVETLRAQH